MAYKKCSHCNVLTDENESKCPACGENPFDEEVIAFDDLISRIKKGEISLPTIWTKNPTKIYQALEGSPQTGEPIYFTFSTIFLKISGWV